MNNFTIVIPVHLNSNRLPGKVLQDIHGKPMLWHVYQRALASNPQRLVIATDSIEILQVAEEFNCELFFNQKNHANGTSRIAEFINHQNIDDDEIIVNVQGDEPLLPDILIAQLVTLLQKNSNADVATLMQSIDKNEYLQDPNIVKVVVDKNNFALYFSRSMIPYCANDENIPLQPNMFFKHIGLYAYRAAFLKKYNTLKRCFLEQIEKLEQLSILYNGSKIITDIAAVAVPRDVNTMADLLYVRRILAENKKK